MNENPINPKPSQTAEEVKVDPDGGGMNVQGLMQQHTTLHDDCHGDPQTDPPTTSTVKKEEVIDFNLFQDIESGDCCDGKRGYCKGLERVIQTLDYHQFLVVNPLDDKYGNDPQTAFISFCSELYPKEAMLNDYIHFVEHHADPKGVEYIRSRLHFSCDSAGKCGATTRHYRDRREDSTSAKGVESNWFIDRIDSIHFMVHHLTELGLRVSMEAMESELAPDDEEQDESLLVDLALKRMGKEIESKRARFTTERLDGAANSKFTLQINEQKGSGHGVGSDGMWSLYTLCALPQNERNGPT